MGGIKPIMDSKTEHLSASENPALPVIDYQSARFITWLLRTDRVGGQQKVFPGRLEIDRTSVYFWESKGSQEAVKSLGGKKFMVCVSWTEICLRWMLLEVGTPNLLPGICQS